MKMLVSIYLLLLICMACNQKDDCQEVKLPIHHLDCENLNTSPQINISNNYVIIRSRETYDAQVTGNCHPVVDFSRYDLLIGRQSSGNEVDTILYDLRRTCLNNELNLNVDIVQSGATRPDNVVYHALIPKLVDEETIRVKVNVQ